MNLAREFGLTPREIRIFELLDERDVVSLDEFHARLFPEPVTDHAINGPICTMRKKLAGKYEVRTHERIGYSMRKI